jgi:hypothetical protein
VTPLWVESPVDRVEEVNGDITTDPRKSNLWKVDRPNSLQRAWDVSVSDD